MCLSSQHLPSYNGRTFAPLDALTPLPTMPLIDVFNGDADGLCALHQLRLADPADAVLITGVKGDIALLQHAPAGAGDRVTVLDISMDANRGPLLAMLARG